MQSRQMAEAQFHEGQIKYMDFFSHRLLSRWENVSDLSEGTYMHILCIILVQSELL